MKQLKAFFQRVLCPTCVLFTFFTFLLGLLSLSASATYEKPVLDLKGLALFFLFSFLLSLLFSGVFRMKEWSMGLRLFVFGLGLTASFGIVFLLLGGYYQKGNAAWLLLGLVAAAYLIFALSFLLGYRFAGKRRKQKETYKNQFGI